MTTELTVLTLAALWQVVQIALFSVTAQGQVGTDYAASPRDEKRELTGIAGRFQRAMNNHFEGLILFGIAAVVISISDQSTTVTQLCAHAYLISRIFYVPAYAQGLTPWRSLIWAVGFVATVTMLIAALI
ncbi:inner membrane protein [Roseibacterium elongatum DSM 19469]|uniref:Inner membrane protein n=1 Tax=Roseicyclus elongatus DSM 19469 TaxID=1294273 RepID=W8SNI9_9RHOB|nr:MAPEG family protein [Roseibacterium elongatum]AHM04105.1 inner membrane protein [Roseibacterium elongatum DSM 19469]